MVELQPLHTFVLEHKLVGRAQTRSCDFMLCSSQCICVCECVQLCISMCVHKANTILQ